MAFHHSSLHYNLYSHEHLPLCNSLSPSNINNFSTPLIPWTPKSFNHSLKLTTQPRCSVSPSPPFVPEKSRNPTSNPSESQDSQYPNQQVTFSAKNCVWVNPKSPRASELHQKSYVAKYDFLKKIAESLNSGNPTEVDVSRILSSLDEKNRVEKDAVVVLDNLKNPETALLALKFFRENLKSKREVILYNVTLKVFRKNRNLDGAEMVFEEMLERGVKPDKITFSTLVSCAKMCGRLDKALAWVEKLPQYGVEPDDKIYSKMIDAYGRSGNTDMALSLYDRAKRGNWQIDVVTLATVMKIYSISGDFDGALDVYEYLKARGMKPNLVIYNMVLDVAGKAKRPWQVKTVFQEMTNNGIAPTFPTYAALLRAYCKARYVEDALSVYEEVKEKGLVLNSIIYNTLLAMCADMGCTDKAIEIFEDMKKAGNCMPDSWTFSSLITTYSCSGNVSEAERMLNEMLEAGIEPDIFVLTSLIQCYGKTNRIDDVLRTFDRLLELGITPDARFCGCLLNVMNQTPKEEHGKLVSCIKTANPKLGYVVKLLVEEESGDREFKQEALELIESISTNVRKAYCNGLMDLCINLNLTERACELLDLGITLGIYSALQSKSPTQWSLHLRSLSHGASLTALHLWMRDLSKALDNAEELPPLLGIDTGHGKHNYNKGLASEFASYLRELNSPFHEAPDNRGWFVTTKVAAESWLKSRNSPEPIAG